MHAKQPILTATAILALMLSGTLLAEDPAAQGASTGDASGAGVVEATDGSKQPLSDADAAYKKAQVDAATAADARYQADRTEANRVARDEAEAKAAEAIQRINGPTPNLDPQR